MAVQALDLPMRERQTQAFRDELISWCLAYAANGYPVFPVNQSKRPLVKWKEGATTDAETIKAWWTRWPTAMIGIPTGKPSGLVVLDFDIKEDANGFESWEALGQSLPQNVIEVKTPSGGSHFYFQYDPARPDRNSGGKVGSGIDVRGDGGYVVVPPSRRADGLDYHYASPQTMGVLVV